MPAEKQLNPVPEEQVDAKKSAEDAIVAVPEKKTAPKKATEKKSAEKKSTVKKTAAKETAEEKAPEKKALAKKTGEEKAPEKKSTAKKAVAKKPADGEAAEKKTVVRKVAAKKAAVADADVVVVVEETAASPEASPEKGATAVEVAVVDFSDEEADLAANSPDLDLGEENADIDGKDDDHPAKPAVDYAGMSKEELVAALEAVLAEKPIQAVRRDAEQIKVAFYKVYRAEVDQLRRVFAEAGGNSEEFVPAADESEKKLKELFAEYRKKRDEYLSGIEKDKEKNYAVKLKIIEELKELIGSSETMNHTFNAFRDLQKRWKETGPVPQAHVKDLWETYNLYVENFYNFIKINKELRDLDLKRNNEAKLELAEEAEALLLEPSVITAFHKLQKLHELWRETGPVSNEYKEQLWERFREASSKINKRHQEYFEDIKGEQKRNLDLKTELCIKTEELAGQPFTTRKEWNKASEQITEIQKVWKTIGFAPKKDNPRIYERFRKACDKFFEAKKNFYAQVKTEMDENLALKNEICEQAETLKDSDDWKKATDEFIALQKRWREIGPVSRRYSDAVWKRFRAACDHFFGKKSTHFSDVDSKYGENLARKEQIIEELKNIIADGKEVVFDEIKEIQRRWSEVGFVPIKSKEAIQKEYRRLVDELFGKLRGGERQRNIERFRGKVSGMKEGGDRRLRNERDKLYVKLKQMESDIALLENNIGFFSKSKNAEAMIKDVNDKIDKLKAEMELIAEKITVIDNQGE